MFPALLLKPKEICLDDYGIPLANIVMAGPGIYNVRDKEIVSKVRQELQTNRELVLITHFNGLAFHLYPCTRNKETGIVSAFLCMHYNLTMIQSAICIGCPDDIMQISITTTVTPLESP